MVSVGLVIGDYFKSERLLVERSFLNEKDFVLIIYIHIYLQTPLVIEFSTHS